MRIELGNQTVDLKPFFKATLIWAGISVILIFVFATARAAALATWFVFFALTVSDLIFLVKTVAATLHLMSDQGAEKRTAYAIQAFVYGGLKLLCLAAIGISLWKFADAPSIGILFGLSALVIVPLGGGFWWSREQLKEEAVDFPNAKSSVTGSDQKSPGKIRKNSERNSEAE